jgi:hypothetical protein
MRCPAMCTVARKSRQMKGDSQHSSSATLGICMITAAWRKEKDSSKRCLKKSLSRVMRFVRSNRGTHSIRLCTRTRADPTGFEPAISALTGPHVWPLHHGSSYSRGREYTISPKTRQWFCLTRGPRAACRCAGFQRKTRAQAASAVRKARVTWPTSSPETQ